MRRQRESGFALLLVFAMSAAIAIMLYQQLPRAAFEAQRAKEELLIERGEQYIRGIQLYVSQWKRYPASMDDLEKSNNKRYLRRRYKDPMTGTDEWRLIHVDGNGVLTDSKVQKTGDKKPSENKFVSEFASVGSAGTSAQGAPNLAMRRRPSDGPEAPGAPGMPSAVNPFGQFSYPAVTAQQQQQQQQQIPVTQPVQPPSPFQPVPGQPSPGQPSGTPSPSQQGQPGQPSPSPQQAPFDPSKPITPQQAYPNGVPQFPGQPQGQAPPGYGQQLQQTPTFPGSPATQDGRPGGVAANNAGAKMVMDSLLRPQPQMQGGVAGVPGLQIGGGIAGVATKYESGSIKVYNEREKYDEWEFVYDIKKDKRLAQQLSGMQGNNQGPNQGLNQGMNQGLNQGQNQGPNQGLNQGSGNTFNNQGGFQGPGFQNAQPIPIPITPPSPGRR